MPQLDKLIFFMENIGFVMSFFFMVFYNQYIFYPKLLKNIFVRKFFLINLNTNIVYKNLLILYKYNINLKAANFNVLFKTFENYYYSFNKKIHFFIIFKLKLIRYFLKLINNKFKFLFSSFYAVYRQYIVEIKKISKETYVFR